MHPALVQVLDKLVSGRAEDMPYFIKRDYPGGCPASELRRASVVQVLGELLCGRAEDMPDVIKRESSRLPSGLSIGMVQVSAVSYQGMIPLPCGFCYLGLMQLYWNI